MGFFLTYSKTVKNHRVNNRVNNLKKNIWMLKKLIEHSMLQLDYDELKKVPIDIFLRLEWFSTFIVKTFFKASSHVNKFLIISSQLQAGCQEDKTLHESKRILPGLSWSYRWMDNNKEFFERNSPWNMKYESSILFFIHFHSQFVISHWQHN